MYTLDKSNLHKKLQPIPPPDRPWVHVGIDLICDMPINLMAINIF